MCEDCTKVSYSIRLDAVSAIATHYTELVKLLAQVSQEANRRKHDEEMTMHFAPYVIGFFCGLKSNRLDDVGTSRKMFEEGHKAGHVWAHKDMGRRQPHDSENQNQESNDDPD